ncbi:hypothetical protein EJ02DRAFT_512756 [Clathrospora elynae]|uniref:Uncharacterized protein n=1 Tax=Clathrospora elynae TaxID=706981 RepID=A0A6A5SN09_9PLEO|nr:hypothetical protein EJ02DRAFT_512756 [Clathrospora elynae]
MDSDAAPPHTPIARRAAPVIKLLAAVCLRCSKRIGEGGEACNKACLKKCAYCARLKKNCNSVPPNFHRDMNALLRSRSRIAAAEDSKGEQLREAFTQARRSYVANVEAFVRQAAKHGGRRRPQGDKIQLLQVEATNRVAAALEGILDIVRQQSGLAPLGDLDAPTDVDKEMADHGNDKVADHVDDEVADHGNDKVANRVDDVPSSGGLLMPTPKRKSKAKAKEKGKAKAKEKGKAKAKEKGKAKAKEKGKAKARDGRRRPMEATEDKDSEPVLSLRCPARSRKAGGCASRRI